MEEFCQFLKDYGELISITLIPIIIWIGSIMYQNREAKIRLKQELFLKLMANRSKLPISSEWVDSLNQIDVVFQDDTKVRTAWRAYYDSLHPNSQHYDNNQSFQLDLLSEIAKVLRYDNLKQTEIARFYGPRQFHSSTAAQALLLQENLRVVLRSDSYNSKKERKEYIQHLDKLLGMTNSEDVFHFLYQLKTEAEKETDKKK